MKKVTKFFSLLLTVLIINFAISPVLMVYAKEMIFHFNYLTVIIFSLIM